MKKMTKRTMSTMSKAAIERLDQVASRVMRGDASFDELEAFIGYARTINHAVREPRLARQVRLGEAQLKWKAIQAVGFREGKAKANTRRMLPPVRE